MDETIERFRITGRVQGVFFRKWAQAAAEEFGLRGFVRNMSDGSVEAVMAGREDCLEAFGEACLSGPPDAQVDGVERLPGRGESLPEEGVEIRPDG